MTFLNEMVNELKMQFFIDFFRCFNYPSEMFSAAENRQRWWGEEFKEIFSNSLCSSFILVASFAVIRSVSEMKFIIVFAFAFFVAFCCAEEKVKPTAQPFIDIKNLKNSFDFKSEVVRRFFRLSSGAANTEAPLATKSFRRLNIFGLQAPPDQPQRDADGKPCSTCNEKIPNILFVVNKPTDRPNFSVVQPQRSQPRAQELIPPTHHYPKLDSNQFSQQKLEQTSEEHEQQNYHEVLPTSFHQPIEYY
jgi:hypothetical protein